jgi:hypothetical protein
MSGSYYQKTLIGREALSAVSESPTVLCTPSETPATVVGYLGERD